MRKVIAITALMVLGSVAPSGVISAEAVQPAASSAPANSTDLQARKAWFDNAVGEILSGDTDH